MTYIKITSRIAHWSYKANVTATVLLTLLLFCSSTIAQQKDYSEYKKIAAFNIPIEADVVKVYLLLDKELHKEFYTANLSGNVCLDNLCRPIDIDIYWDLVGNFADYQTTVENSLTKFDHIQFTKEDHTKLRSILNDPNSLLRDYQLNDLIDTTVKVVSLVKVDAVTGATNPTFAAAIVHGAVYTVYKLWHFVNSDIKEKILEHSEKNVFTDQEIKRLLLSGNNVYQYFLLNYLAESKIRDFKKELIALINDKDDYVPLYALGRLPKELWDDTDFQMRVLTELEQLKHPVRMIILNSLSTKKLNENELAMLIKTLPILTVQELPLAFSILKKNKAQIDNKLLQEIKELSNRQQTIVHEYAHDFIIEF